jgi:endonuclease G
MKNTKIVVLLLCLSASLSACNFINSKHKPLIGNYASSEEQKEQPVESDAKGADGIEIPAKLKGVPEQILYRTAYTASYNESTLLPNWVAWHLTADHTSGNHTRQGVSFHDDSDVPEPRAMNSDYTRSGYDRGHMCPSGDNKWNGDAQKESFLMTNICPQDHQLNMGDWNDLEMKCRDWAKDFGDIYIVAGPIFRGEKHKTIGDDGVTVPEAFFKVVLCMNIDGEPNAIGFIYDNNSQHHPMDYYAVTVDDVEKITGIDFFPTLPDNVENTVEAKIGNGFLLNGK